MIPPRLLAITNLEIAGGQAALCTQAAALHAVLGPRLWILVRDKGASPAQRAALALALRRAVPDAVLIAHGGPLPGCDGVHLPDDTTRGAAGSVVGAPPDAGAAHIGSGQAGPPPDLRHRGWMGRSAHDAAGLACDADYFILGPVGPVPGKGPPLGWRAFAGACRGCPRPVLALGGLGPDDLQTALEAGAAGIAAIRAAWLRPAGSWAGAP